MGKNARLRKLRRESQRLLRAGPAKTSLAKAYQKNHPDCIVVCGGAAEKMSEVLEDFAEPLLSAARSPEDTKKALLIAMVAWNYSLLDDAARAESDSAQSKLLADPDMRSIFEYLEARKQQLYPDNRRAI